jgi:hypothetical protein
MKVFSQSTVISYRAKWKLTVLGHGLAERLNRDPQCCGITMYRFISTILTVGNWHFQGTIIA